MWIRRRPKTDEAGASHPEPGSLKDTIRQTRIEAAERSAVVVDLRDAELARLELLNEALDPLFKQIPADIDLFDRGIGRGDTPRLWVDAIAHVVMGRDKRRYRFVQDTRYGRKILAESNEIPDIVKAVTHYVANRMIEREKALASAPSLPASGPEPQQGGGRTGRAFFTGLVAGAIALFAILSIIGSKLLH